MGLSMQDQILMPEGSPDRLAPALHPAQSKSDYK
ncbi:hypothetical protein BH09PSE5_BH09PSE5_06450 [soil metagenome]